MDSNNTNSTNKYIGRKQAGNNVLYADLSYKLMAAVFEVHNQLGPGFTENIYEEALAVELSERGIPFERQKSIQIFYKNNSVGNYRLDFVIYNLIILAIKAVSEILDIFKQQVLSYLAASGFRLSILVNFGGQRVQSVRIAH